jgi:hypothetical protein
MPWRCPACGIAIQHYEYAPRPERLYRCAICRLDLQFDAALQRMTLAPIVEPTPIKILNLDISADRRRPRRADEEHGEDRPVNDR